LGGGGLSVSVILLILKGWHLRRWPGRTSCPRGDPACQRQGERFKKEGGREGGVPVEVWEDYQGIIVTYANLRGLLK